jgi:hypothetical protein
MKCDEWSISVIMLMVFMIIIIIILSEGLWKVYPELWSERIK